MLDARSSTAQKREATLDYSNLLLIMKDDNVSLPGKKGICLLLPQNDSVGNLEKIVQLAPSWNYSWNSIRSSTQPENMEFVPMIWGGAKTIEMMQQRIEDTILPQIEAGTCKRILCINEPDKKEQANMTVEKVLEFWPLFEKLGVPLCSPSCANPLGCKTAQDCCQGVQGSWMQDFMYEIDKRGYRCDYIGVHWYGGPSLEAFKKRLKEVHDAYGGTRPLLITEFAVADWKCMARSPVDNRFEKKQVLAFMQQALPWLESQHWIAGYSWFPFKIDCPQGTCSALFNNEGELTALGKYYRSVTRENPKGNQSIQWNP
jgi:hypothetical protein